MEHYGALARTNRTTKRKKRLAEKSHKKNPTKAALEGERSPKSENTMCQNDTDMWRLCKAGRFSYGESPRTPPLEGTSLHRRNNSVERPWGILSLFTTCLRLWVKSHCHLLPHLQNMPLKAVEKKEESHKTVKRKSVVGFLHSVNHTWSPQNKSYIQWFTVTLYQGKTVSHLNASLKKIIF